MHPYPAMTENLNTDNKMKEEPRKATTYGDAVNDPHDDRRDARTNPKKAYFVAPRLERHEDLTQITGNRHFFS